MSINTDISALKSYLPQNSTICSLLLTQEQKEWYKTLEKADTTGQLLVDVFEAITNHRKVTRTTPFETAKLHVKGRLKKLIEQKQLSDPLQKKYKEIAQLYKKVIEDQKQQTSQAQSGSPSQTAKDKRGIGNLGGTCWLNILLQHLRMTDDFESHLNGPIQNAETEDEKQKLSDLQKTLRDAVQKLRNPLIATLIEKDILEILEKMYLAGIIKTEANDTRALQVIVQALSKKQFDHADVRAKLFNRLGKAPDDLKIDLVKIFDDKSEEVQKNNEVGNIIPFPTSREGHKVSEFLSEYFSDRELSTVEFKAQKTDGTPLKTYPGSIGNSGRFPELRVKLGKKEATPEIIINEQIAHIKQLLNYREDCRGARIEVRLVKEGEKLLGFEILKNETFYLGYPSDFGITKDYPVVYAKIGERASEKDLHDEQIKYIKTTDYPGQDDVHIICVKTQSRKRKISSLPKSFELAVRSTDGKPNVEEMIDLKDYLQKDMAQNNTQYELYAVMCRSGLVKDNAGGHFWSYYKEGDSWTRFNDSTVTPNSNEHFNSDVTKAYSLFYRRKINQ